MKILLTGGSGQVGTEFRRRAQGLDLLAPGRSEFDLSRPESLGAWLDAHRPDVILSVGAYTAVDRAEDEPDVAFRVNRDAVAVMADYAQQHGKPLVHLSTDYVFDGNQPEPYLASDSTGPTGVYGASKLGGEEAARAADHHLILRVSWVFAARGGNFVRTMLRFGAEREVLRVVDDQFGGPTWAGHIAQALRTLVDRLAAGESLPSGTWHHAGEPHVSWCQFAREVLALAHARGLIPRVPRVDAIATHEYPTKARRPANSRLDNSAAERELGLKAPDWRQGLADTLEELARG
ncbi:MAG: dTDP-4-dehydrorhamnose reductase [Panacagrimonas sp.]